MSGPHSHQPGILHTLAAELAPYPGRLRGSLRDTLGVVIAIVLAMTLRVPGIALALALLYMQRERSFHTISNGFQILSGVAIGAIATLFWVQITDGTEVARFFGVMFFIFIAAFCMAVTKYPLLFTMFGFYGFLDLAAWDARRGTNAIVTDILYNLAAVAVVTLSAIGVEYLFGARNPSEDLSRAMEDRLTLLSRFFHAMAQPEGSTLELHAIHTSLVGYALARAQRMKELYSRICDHCPDLSRVPVGSVYRIDLLASILEKSALIGFRREGCKGHRDHYAAIAGAARHSRPQSAAAAQCPFAAPRNLYRTSTVHSHPPVAHGCSCRTLATSPTGSDLFQRLSAGSFSKRRRCHPCAQAHLCSDPLLHHLQRHRLAGNFSLRHHRAP